MKCSVKSGENVAYKNTQVFFTWRLENKLFMSCVLWLIDSRIHRNMKIARDDSVVSFGCTYWCGIHSTYQKGYQSNLLVVHSKGARCNIWGLFHCDDLKSPWWASSLYLNIIAVALTPSWLVWILTVMPVWLYFSSFLLCFVLFCFVYWAWKHSKLGLFISFPFEEFRLCSRYRNVNYGAWHVYKPLFGSSVAICRLACSKISLSINKKKSKEKF